MTYPRSAATYNQVIAGLLSTFRTLLLHALVLGATVARADDLPARVEAFTDGYVRALQRHDHLAGAVVTVVLGDRVLLEKGYGIDRADGRAVDPARTLFRIGSISKTFTWTLLLQLVEEGKVSLQAPVNRYLPERARIPDDGEAPPVLVQHLLCHSAGFEDLSAGYLYVFSPEKAEPLQETVAHHRPHRVRPPGEASVYSNYGAALAGLIVAEQRGRPFEDVVEERILEPLRLSRTTFREPYGVELAARRGLPRPLAPALAADVSAGFRWRDGRWEERPFEYLFPSAPSGAASTTAVDMARYLRAFLGGGALEGRRILEAETVSQLSTFQLCANAPGTNGLAWGFMQRVSSRGWRSFGHPGGTLWFASNMAIFPDAGLGVFVSGNTEGVSGKLTLDLPNALADELLGDADGRDTRPPARTSAEDLARFTGTWLGDRRAYSNVEKLAELRRLLSVTATPEGRLVVSAAGESQRLESVDKVERDGATFHRFRSLLTGELLAFVERPGQPLRMTSASGVTRSTKVGFFDGPPLLACSALAALLGGLLALISGLHRLVSRPRERSTARAAAGAMAVAGLCWLVAVGGIAVAFANFAQDHLLFYTDWPGAPLRVGTAAAAAGTVLSALAIVLAVRDGSAGWPPWRRLRLVAVLVCLAVAPAGFWAWNLVGWKF
jgi:CubicO group peptidase (beta-lactamase class C family)